MLEEIHIRQRISALKLNAAQRYSICPEKCHVGHLALEGMLGTPNMLNQIDAANDTNETNESVALRSMRLASALNNYGLVPGDSVVVMGPNHLDMAIPYYACHFNGYSLCGMDPTMGPADLKGLFPFISPKVTFCHKTAVESVKDAYTTIGIEGKLIVFDDDENNLERFIKDNQGTEIDFRPAEFNHSEVPAWLMLTSGTTGLPKVSVIPFDTLLNAICCWWEQFTDPIENVLSMASFQWLSSLMYFITAPLRQFTRLQCSKPLTLQVLVGIINKYKPNVTAWTPFILGQFLLATEKICDLTCFKYIAITGSPIEKPIYDILKRKCDAYLYLVYSMTELLVPAFDYNEDTPFGSVGKPYEKYEYRIVDDEDQVVEEPFKNGELWMRGNDFFKGYLKNPEETRKVITEDGWFKTDDIFYKDNENNYFFVERKRMLIRSAGYWKDANLEASNPGADNRRQFWNVWTSPLQLEEIVRRHPAVAQVCVVGIPDKIMMEAAVAAIVRKKDQQIDPKEIFSLVNESMQELRRLHGGIFYLDNLPVTPSGKVHRLKVKEIALTAERILPPPSL